MSFRSFVTSQKGCESTEIGGQNQLTRLADTLVQDPLRMQQMREGYNLQQQGYNVQNMPNSIQRAGPVPHQMTHNPTDASFFQVHQSHQAPQSALNWSQSLQQQQKQPQQMPQMMHQQIGAPPPMMMMMPAPFMMPQMMAYPPQMMSAPMPQMTAIPQATSTSQQQQQQQHTETSKEETSEAARNLVEKLESLDDEKVNGSEFLSFMQNVASGQMTLSQNQALDAQGNPVVWDELYGQPRTQSSSSIPVVDTTEARLQALYDRLANEEAQIAAAMTQQQQDEANPSVENDALWENMLRDIQQLQAGMESNAAEAQNRYIFPQHYANEISVHDNPIELVEGYLKQGEETAAVAAMEAHLEKNPGDAERWRELGLLHSDADRDLEAILCLKRSHEADPFDSASMLALGVSLTNELDMPQALKLLQEWVQTHPDLYELQDEASHVMPEDFQGKMAFVANLLAKAKSILPDSQEVNSALGVVANITRDFRMAVECFKRTCMDNGGGHRGWNKLGATLANSQQHVLAIPVYHMAIACKPHYPRAWSNLGIAHANLNKHHDALKFYLMACALAPDAGHLWHYVHSTLLTLNRHDLLDLLDRKDIDGLLAATNSPGPDSLPAPMDPQEAKVRAAALIELVEHNAFTGSNSAAEIHSVAGGDYEPQVTEDYS